MFVLYNVFQQSYPIVKKVCIDYGKSVQENIALFVGMCVFVLLNYFGQCIYVFRK